MSASATQGGHNDVCLGTFNCLSTQQVNTFRVRRSRGEMYIGHGRLCVCLFLAAFPYYCTNPDVSWGIVWGALELYTIGRICNRCTGFVAMTA